jgi:hypothetical protein
VKIALSSEEPNPEIFADFFCYSNTYPGLWTSASYAAVAKNRGRRLFVVRQYMAYWCTEGTAAKSADAAKFFERALDDNIFNLWAQAYLLCNKDGVFGCSPVGIAIDIGRAELNAEERICALLVGVDEAPVLRHCVKTP